MSHGSSEKWVSQRRPITAQLKLSVQPLLQIDSVVATDDDRHNVEETKESSRTAIAAEQNKTHSSTSTPFSEIFRLYGVPSLAAMSVWNHDNIDIATQCAYLQPHRIWNAVERNKLISELSQNEHGLQDLNAQTGKVYLRIRSKYMLALYHRDSTMMTHDIGKWSWQRLFSSFLTFLIDNGCQGLDEKQLKNAWEFTDYLRQYLQQNNYGGARFVDYHAQSEGEKAWSLFMWEATAREFGLKLGSYMKARKLYALWAHKQMLIVKQNPPIKSEEENKLQVQESTTQSKCYFSPQNCGCIQRITKALLLHRQLEGSDNHDALLKHFSDDKHGNLLDDWHHILFAHLGDQLTVKESEEQFQLIYEELAKHGPLEECSIATCSALRRSRRDRVRAQLFEDGDVLSFSVDTLDVIHSHLLHSFESGFRMRTSDAQSGEYVGVDRQRSRRLRDTRDRFTRFRRMDTHTNSKFITSIISTDDTSVDRQTLTKHPDYSFGFVFQHGKPKYASLQDEIVNNDVRTLPLSIFKNLLIDAVEKSKSKHGRRVRCRVTWSKKYNMRISPAHIMAAILYCDFDRLSYQFSLTFRKISVNESTDAVKKRNLEFAIWSRLLSEVVWDFGEKVSDIWDPTFYFGINQKMVFSSFYCCFIGPTSVTKKRDVARSFATNNGIVLKLTMEDGDLRFFNMTWISRYSNEDERFTMRNVDSHEPSYALQMRDIQCLQTGDDYRFFVRAFTQFHRCIQRRLPTPAVPAKKVDGAIIKLMFENNPATGLPAYAYSLFRGFAAHVKHAKIDVEDMHEYYEPFHLSLFRKNEYLFRFATFCKIFSKLESVDIFFDCANKPDLSLLWRKLLIELVYARRYINNGNGCLEIKFWFVEFDDELLEELNKAEFIQDFEKNAYYDYVAMSVVCPSTTPKTL